MTGWGGVMVVVIEVEIVKVVVMVVMVVVVVVKWLLSDWQKNHNKRP